MSSHIDRAACGKNGNVVMKMAFPRRGNFSECTVRNIAYLFGDFVLCFVFFIVAPRRFLQAKSESLILNL